MPRDGAPTRVRLLDAAERLVLRNGFAATSVDQILEESRSSKGAFFHHFASKRALAHALVARWVDADLGMLESGLAAAREVEEPVGQVMAFLGHYERWAESLVAEDSACLYITALIERDLLDESTSGEIARAVRAWRVAFAALLRRAYDAAHVADGPDVDDLADHLFATFEGAFLMCRLRRSAEPMRSQLRVLRQLVEALLGQPPVPAPMPAPVLASVRESVVAPA